MALPSVRFVGGHFDAPDLFDFDCRVVRMSPTEIVLQPLDRRAARIVLNSRYIGRAIGSVEDAHSGRAVRCSRGSGGRTARAAHRQQEADAVPGLCCEVRGQQAALGECTTASAACCRSAAPGPK